MRPSIHLSCCTLLIGVVLLSSQGCTFGGEPCVPASCELIGALCGQMDDGCGSTLACGECDPGLACSDQLRCRSIGWQGVALDTVSAPTRNQVRIVFASSPGPDVVEGRAAYSVLGPQGPLAVEHLIWDPASISVSLTTAQQTLGLTYRLEVQTGEGDEPLTADFPAADTARFWASDFGDPDFADYRLTAKRAGLGEHCVVYLEEGISVSDVAWTIETFDRDIYPTLTTAYQEAPDVDGNDRIVLLGLDGGPYYGGYFSGVNQLEDEQTINWWGMHSNEMEMLYINGVQGSLYPEMVIPHEFSHLLYYGAHGFTNPYWAYHDEGLAECAVGLVYGQRQYAIDYYLWDPDGLIGAGLSLVNWGWGEYANYVQAYLFWSYVAAQTDGLSTYGELFDLPTGHPDEVDAWLTDRLGMGFADVLRDKLLADWVQAEQGPYGYKGFLSFAPASCPGVPAGTQAVSLEPYTGTFFRPELQELDYPGTQGPNILYAGIDSDLGVDLEAPFLVDGGGLLVLNRSTEWRNFPAEHAGPDLLPGMSAAAAGALLPIALDRPFSPAWLDPPPRRPGRTAALQAWRRAVISRLAE